jgi:hypothetical protein
VPDQAQSIQQRIHAGIEQLRARIAQLRDLLDESEEKNAILEDLIGRHEAALRQLKERADTAPPLTGTRPRTGSESS